MNMVLDENLFFYAALVLILLTIILGLWIWRLERRIKKILGNKKSGDLETAILDSHRRLRELETFRENASRNLEDKEKRIQRSVQAIETIRFNPFKGTGDGGNQSFSSALINEKGKGVVFTGIYSRERISIYAKPLTDFKGEFELSEEEKEALKRAQFAIKRQNLAGA